MSSFDSFVADVVADHVFARAMGGGCNDAKDEHPAAVGRDFAHQAWSDAAAEAKLVEALKERCAGRIADDPSVVASFQRAAQTAWAHYCHARAAAAGAEGDPTFAPLARDAVLRARRAALALGRASARAVTRAAIRARNAARARSSAPLRRCPPHPRVGLSARTRAPARRRVRLSAVASAGSGGEEPGPEPPHPCDWVRLPVRRRP